MGTEDQTKTYTWTVPGVAVKVEQRNDKPIDYMNVKGSTLSAEDARELARYLNIAAAQMDDSVRTYAERCARESLEAAEANAREAEASARAHLDSIYNVDQETAATEFAGTGITVNIYGLPADNAAAVGEAVDWTMRTVVGKSPAFTPTELRRKAIEQLEIATSNLASTEQARLHLDVAGQYASMAWEMERNNSDEQPPESLVA